MAKAKLKFEFEHALSSNNPGTIDLVEDNKELGLDCVMLNGENVLLTSLYEKNNYTPIK